MHKQGFQLKLIILVFVGLLTSLFFIRYSSRYLFPSRATQQPISVLFGSLDPTTDTSGTSDVDIFFSVTEGSSINTAQIALTYDPNQLEILPMDGSSPSRLCTRTGAPLSELTQFFDAKERGVVVLTRHSKSEPGGEKLFCWGTIPVHLKDGVDHAELTFKDDTNAWMLTGSSSFYPVFLTSKSITITR